MNGITSAAAADAHDGGSSGEAVSDTGLTAIRFAPVIAANETMPFTQYHSKYFAYELTKRVGADQADKLAQSLSNATVDLNPHQVDAALFAFRSPLSRGAILADEVGLGKTIEAGIVISQLWAEKKRRVLVIVPASLRKQWSSELANKFFIPSVLLESKSFREMSRNMPSPFQPQNQVVICSYQFARSKAAEVTAVPWDLVVIDEAHRLRNVYKKDNKIARTLRDALYGRPKILLTATPLQNSLMELYGLVTFVDEHVFGSEDAFRELYGKKSKKLSAGVLANLRARLAPICQRTLRKQVVEYVRYTRRIPITEDFTPSRDEQRLYDQVSAYLQKDNLHALPNSQRQLIELVLRKILASSSFAIAATLGTMIERLKKLERAANEVSGEHVVEVVGDDFEQADGLEEEWDDNNFNDVADNGADGNTTDTAINDTATGTEQPAAPDPAELLKSLRAEAAELMEFKTLAESI
ncbi:MAG TPA: DEAD/DEAH box helicase, partial [Planctomycetaceae bacterium]|nr:DEAD/DEAH box helicase [Planctomycetaceae bacterium]